MLIKDQLAMFYSNREFATPEAKYKYELYFGGFSKAMEEVAKSHSGYAFLLWLIRRSIGADGMDSNVPLHPDMGLAVCEELGLTTLEQLHSWLEGFQAQSIPVGAINKLISSNFNLPDWSRLPLVKYDHLIESLLRSGWVTENDWGRAPPKDNEYRLFSEDDVKRIAKASPTDKFRWRAEERDCDDFGAMFSGWLSSLAYGNGSKAEIEINLYGANDEYVGAHALNLIWSDQKVYIFEPQANALFTPENQSLSMAGVKQCRIRYLSM